ncbi:hypothetical protein [Longitalea luteola]|uniref:hypothetical protein n=1 Tax=Longitalea luteola TaxID=2812563 RepID=UPI001A95FDB8|nr:hypothetical protein [Longitalea luteola]
MTKCYQLLLIVAVVIGMAACQKEVNENDITNPGSGPAPADTIPNAPGNNSEVGTWKFISVRGTGSQTATFSQSGASAKAVTSTDFTSGNNSGTITFDSFKMTATNIALSVNTTAKTLVYMNGVLFDSVQTPISQTVPPQSATSSYKKVGADSLHFQDGAFLDALTGGLLPNTPTGCKVAFEGTDIMKLTIVFDTVTTQDYQGIPAKLTIHTVLVATLKKQ